MTTNRRVWLTVALGICVVLVLGTACGGPAPTEQKPTEAAQPTEEEDKGVVVPAHWGGAAGEVARKQYDSFEEETDTKVNDVTMVTGEVLAKMSAMQSTGQWQWDLVEVEPFVIYQREFENAWADIDYSLWDEADLEAMPEEHRQKDRVRNSLGSLRFCWNPDEFEKGPEGWVDFYDTERFPGKRAVTDFANYVLEGALLADGVAPEDLYPLDYDRALAKMDTIADDLVFFVGGPPGIELLVNGEVSLVFTWSPAIFRAIDSEANITWGLGQCPAYGGFLVIPKNSPNPENAQKLMAYLNRADVVWKAIVATGGSPTNANALPYITDEKALARMVTTPENISKMYFPDYEWYAEIDPDTGLSNDEVAREKLEEWKLTH